MKTIGFLGLTLALLGGWGCGGDGGPAQPQRLVDLFSDAQISGGSSAEAAVEATEWNFDEPAGKDDAGWQVAAGVRGQAIQNGVLRGTSTPPSPVLTLAWSPDESQKGDYIHSVRVRMKASAGSRLSFATSSAEELVLGPFLAPDNPFGWSMTSPLIPGDEVTTYTLRPVSPVAAAGIQHLLLRPVDTPGADFEIESIQVIFEREHLSGIPSGVNWQGLGGIFRETVVSRSPETLSFALELPSDPIFDLSVGTLEAGATSFEVSVATAGGETRSLRHTVTTPQRWESFAVPLDGLGGQEVTLSLRLVADRPGTLGLWGAPVVRDRADPAAASLQGVIVVLMDTLRQDHLSFYGHDRETAPLLARLAGEGLLVEDPLAQATWTKVSVPSIFTSLYPTSHTVADLPDLLPASAVTMAEVFRDAGYATVGFSAIPFTGKMTNLHQGYEVFHESSMDVSTGGELRKAARPFVDILLPWLDAHRDVPFFVFLHIEDPHSPYFAPAPYATRWADGGDAERYREMIEKVRPAIDHPLMRQFGMPKTEDLEETGVDAERYVAYELDAYDALIRSMDDEISRVVEKLEALGLSDRVLLAFTSDHGTEFLDHDAHFHGQSVYGELNRVPMFFWGPSVIPSPARVPGTVENLDFMPTVLELAGLEVPEAAQGQSLVPWLEADGVESAAASAGWRRRPAITEKASLPFRGPDGFASTAIVDDGWKLILNIDPPPGVPEIELFDHLNDPLNLDNRAEEFPDRVETLALQLSNWQEFAQSKMLKSDQELASEMSPEELERLRSLGYL